MKIAQKSGVPILGGIILLKPTGMAKCMNENEKYLPRDTHYAPWLGQTRPLAFRRIRLVIRLLETR